MNTNEPSRLIPARAVRQRFGDISSMTLWRWVQQGILPEPVKINGRNYWPETAIEAVSVRGAKRRTVAA